MKYLQDVMEMVPWLYIAAGVAAAALIVALRNWKGSRTSGNDPIGAIAAFLIIMGVIFGEDQNLAYGFIGFGAALFVLLQISKPKK
jgi:hypothetical protein